MKNLLTIILLGLLAIVGVFTLDVYLPGMPSMAQEFGVSISQISFTFISFSIIFAISQLFHGPLSDRIGRKPVLLGGLFTAAIATLFCIRSKNYEVLLAARILQAIGISVFVVVNAIIRDLCIGNSAVQLRTFVTTMSGISISIAPTIGGMLQKNFSWRGGFIASFVLISIAFIYVVIFFPESNANHTNTSFRLTLFVKSYLQLFSNKNYFLYAAIATLAYTVHFSFIIMSANVFIDLLGFTPLTFGYLMFVYGGVYFLSGIFAVIVSRKLPISVLIKRGGLFIGMGGLLMLVLSLITSLNVFQILLPMSLMTIGITIVRSAAATGALAPIPENAGQGAAGLNLMQFMLSAFIATGVSQLGGQPQLSLALLATISAVIIIVLLNLFNWTRFFVKPITEHN